MTRTRMTVVLATAWFAMIVWAALPRTSALATNQAATGDPPPTTDQIKSLFARAVENQHRNERALEIFERVERVITRKSDNANLVSDRTTLLVPSGNDNMKLSLAENGSPVSQETYRHELEYALSTLNLALHPNERYKQDQVKFEKRRREHAEFVDTALKAFRMTWAGREKRGSRTYAKFLLVPDPNFTPTSHLTETFEHVRATIWMDESDAQFARVEGDIATDITFGGGIVGKVYHGGHFTMEQSEVAPGVWFPSLYTYDVDGRKFLFGFGVHERTEISRYRRVGSPSEAIEIIRNELNNLTAEAPSR